MASVEVNIVRRSFSVISDKGSGVFTIQKEKVTIYEALAMESTFDEETYEMVKILSI